MNILFILIILCLVFYYNHKSLISDHSYYFPMFNSNYFLYLNSIITIKNSINLIIVYYSTPYCFHFMYNFLVILLVKFTNNFIKDSDYLMFTNKNFRYYSYNSMLKIFCYYHHITTAKSYK